MATGTLFKAYVLLAIESRHESRVKCKTLQIETATLMLERELWRFVKY